MAIDRRTFLALTATASLAPHALAAGARHEQDAHMLQMNGYPLDAETPLELLTDYLTPNELFFVRSHWIPRVPDAHGWHLVIDGEVERPLKLSLADLKAMPATEATCVLQCSGNGRGLYEPPVSGVQWHYGAVGNARWRGVALRELLERAGVREAAAHLHTFGADTPPDKVPPFHRSIEIEKGRTDALVAWEMNGHPIPAGHGAPLRLIVPGWAGDHWMKWLTRISAQRDPATGFYMDTAYRYPITPGEPGVAIKPEAMRPVTSLFVKSNFTAVPKKAHAGKPVTLRGIAFSGAPDIRKVEISDDDGASWSESILDSRHADYAWRLWSFEWRPHRAGKNVLFARATDSAGQVQPRTAVWNPSGYLYNAWHSVEIEVAA